MHIPDGFLSTPVWLSLNAVGAPAIGWLARRAQRETQESAVPLLGVMGAFVFAAQMINFPIAAGTSGHLIGSALLTYTLGPAAAAIVMTAVLALQALIFQDGGILALGANVCNMALAGVLAAHLCYRHFGRGRARSVAIFLGAALSVLVAACLALAQLLLSGVPVPFPILWLSLGLFSVGALIEGGITLAVLQALEKLNPGWVRAPDTTGRPALGILLVAALVLATAGVLFASSEPDSLEYFAERTGIADQARNLLETPLADYQARFIESPWLAQTAAGLAGFLAILATALLLGKWLTRRRSA